MKRLTMLLALLLALASLTPALAEGEPEKALTLMIYMCGSNLESQYGSAYADIEEIRASGVDTQAVNVLLLTGGSACWHTGQDADAMLLQSLGFSRRSGENRWYTQDTLPTRSMGDAGTLSDFIDWGVEAFPARQYALILWDHGAGPLEGVCYDEPNDPDRLTLDELARALEQARLPGPLSWIGFDACLMSTLEVADRLSPYARYMIASQAREPAMGWNYAFLSGLAGDADGAGTGARIIEAYRNTEPPTPLDRTLSCVDLSAVELIERGLDDMYGAMAAELDRANFSRLSRLRFAATGFGKAVEPGDSIQGYDLVDLVSLCDCYADSAPEAARAIRDAVDRAVVCHWESLPDCCGLSVYHPFRNRRQFKSNWREGYRRLGFCPGYSSYVDAYGEIMIGALLVLWNNLKDIHAGEDPGEGGDSLVTLKITDAQAENLASARLVVLGRNYNDAADDAFFRVYSTAEVSAYGNRLTARYRGQSLQIMNESGTAVLTGSVSYRVTEEGSLLLNLYPVEQDGTRWDTPVIAEYTVGEGGTLYLKGYSAFDPLTGAYSSRAEVDLSRFKALAFINEYRCPTANGAGEWVAFDQWTEDAHRDVQLGSRYVVNRTAIQPTFAMELTRAEELYAAFELTDTQGNVCMSDMVPLSERSVQYYRGETTLGAAFPEVYASAATSWEDRAAVVTLFIQNLSDEEQFYAVFDAGIDGQAAKSVEGMVENGDGSPFRGKGAPCVRPGEWGWLDLTLDERTLAGVTYGDALQTLSGTLWAVSNDPNDTGSFISFSADLGLPADVITHGAGDAPRPDEDIDDVPLRLRGDDGTGVNVSWNLLLRPARDAANSRLLVNTVVANNGDGDIVFAVSDLKVNGVPVQGRAANAAGTGEAVRNGRLSVAPGERTAASIPLDARSLAPIAPDPAINALSFRLAIYRMEDGQPRSTDLIPVEIATDIPLDCFYADAGALPSMALLDAGRANGALDADSARTLFECERCAVSLQGLFVSERQPIMLLRCENRTDEKLSLRLGRGMLDGQPAPMGGSTTASVVSRNNRVLMLGLDSAPWPETRGVEVIMAPGEQCWRYVSLEPASDGQTQFSTLSLEAYLYKTGAPREYTRFGPAGIRLRQAAPLQAGVEAVATADELAVRPGSPLETAPDAPLFQAQVRLPGGDLAARAIPLTLAVPGDERAEKGFYLLLRRVRSDGDLGRMNLLNMAPDNAGLAGVRFDEGQEWYLYEAAGPLAVSEDGRTATALYPGLRPVLCGCGDVMPLTVCYTAPLGDGRIGFDQSDNVLGFTSVAFPYAVLPLGVGSIALALDPDARAASLTGYKTDGSGLADDLRGVVSQDARLLPADADPDTWAAFMRGEAGVTLTQVLALEEATLQLAIEAVDNPEDYCVGFYYKTLAGEIRCVPPRPLTDFIADGTQKRGIEP